MTKTMKRLFAVLVSAALLVSCFAFSGNALDGAPTGTEAMTIGLTLDKTEANPGDTVTVTIRLANNYNAITMRWPVLFSKAFFELDGENGGMTAPINTIVSVPGNASAGTSAGFIPDAYVADYDALTIQWLAGGDSATGVVGSFNSAEAVDCFTFTLKVKDDAQGSGSVFIPADSEFFYYGGINNPANALTSYTSATPFDFTVGGAQTVALLAAAEPVLSAAEGFDVRVISFDDDETEYLVGFDAEEILDNGGDYCDQFVVENGTYTVSDDVLMTGGTVTVYDANGDVYKTYTTIFFGDVDCDGAIDISDAAEVIYMMEYIKEDPALITVYAADVDVMDETAVDLSSIDIGDYSQIIYFLDFIIARDAISQTHTPT